tara:strand:- start:2832 stop:3602 length:771 start_codon:yes stop_codon:yes gene_type:complete
MRNNFLTVVVTLIIVGFGANLFSKHVINRLEKNELSINHTNSVISEIEKSIQDISARTAQAISSNELRNAYITIEDNKRFFEYEVKMSRKSIEKFISKLNEDMEGLNDMVNKNNSNNQILEEKLNFLLQEIELLNQTQDIIEDPIETPQALDTLRGSLAIESYREEEQCAYELMSGTQNKTSLIQKAVDRERRRGDYTLVVSFDVNNGTAIISNVNSNDAPNRLEKAVQSYVSQLKFVAKDSLQSNCEMSFNLNVT